MTKIFIIKRESYDASGTLYNASNIRATYSISSAAELCRAHNAEAEDDVRYTFDAVYLD